MAARATPPTVFVVDDDISIRKSLELLIAQAGWQPSSRLGAGVSRAALPSPHPELPGARCEPARSERTRASEAHRQ